MTGSDSADDSADNLKLVILCSIIWIVRGLSAGEKWQPKHDAVLVIRVKQDEQLFSKLEEAVIISKKDKVVQKRVSKL